MKRTVFARLFFLSRFQSLKSRLIAILLVSTLIPILLIGTISYFSILSIFDNKIRNSIANQLLQTGFFLENTLTNLNYASQQLTYEGGVGQYLEKFLQDDEYEDKKTLFAMYIQNRIDLLRAANPNLGLGFYYMDNNQVLLQKPFLNQAFTPDKLALLFSQNELSYYGPHISMDRLYDTHVFALTRRIYLPQKRDFDIYFYVETDPRLLENLFQKDQGGLDMSHVIVNQAGEVVYSQNQFAFPLGSRYAVHTENGNSTESSIRSGYDRDNYIFEKSSYQGWKVVAVLPETAYNSEKKRWIGQFALVAIFSLSLAIGLAWIIWKPVYRAVTGLNKKLRSLQEESDFYSSIEYSGVTEFDTTLREFDQMRQKIWLLLKEVEQKEKKRNRLEVEKLLFQINPHFLHNTLDTVRWLARLNGQVDIERLISTLNKLLHYNMGKGGETTLQTELDALEDYVVIQKIRYDFEFKLSIQAEEQWLGMTVPRFLLQPLVENSLYHGGGDDGIVEVRVYADAEKWICIEVRDNGKGMDGNEIRSLLEGKDGNSGKVGLGIGISYVYQIIKVHFGQDARLDIVSERGKGTSAILRLPNNFMKEG